MHTFFLAPHYWKPPYLLDGQEAVHLIKVLRAKPGTTIKVLDGQGRLGLFKLEQVKKRKAYLQPVKIWTQDKPNKKLYLAIGWTKSSRRAWILEKAVELKAWKIIFWPGEFSQGRPGQTPKENWRNRLIAAAKQCQNPWLPEVLNLSGLSELIHYAQNFKQKIVLWEKCPPENIITGQDICKEEKNLVVIGPEGGLSAAEVKELTQNGFKTFSLGTSILRWETAAIVCLSLHYLELENANHLSGV
ncbi:16S rRNA (uracil(1498)-N(3))-methyltransferase [Desulfohalobiaceae bacterium Ax17]|jgi:16S rRNA (uracil1498-N3)-methyltransferase|uniref:16S rRNA (uracil(1498)-N(3))-methyltransferase n=1 Tax=Desulfovulcanus ferrireducens TaxID=2831190 RepID=UPI00207BB2E5|nr:16S rRNA (uracil(1498)-N(3))-methyltransferase [Desulfovulcanus ferrireducens]MBT8763410.1 16S rRNA (uracil(1498)-N(3))-methyltransferase [Desulfovulcanus ferrireducens]